MKNPRNTQAVSEILGEILLLAIAVTSISVIYMQVLSTPGPTDSANVTILGGIEKGRPVFELQRGESLGSDTRIIITSAGFKQEEFVLNDPVLQKYLHNEEWDIGERIIIPIEDITGINVAATIVDTKTNAIVFQGDLQKGLTFRYRGGIWHFDEPWWNGTYDEVKDSSLNNNHGRRLGNASIITPPNGLHNNSGDFNGFVDVVKVNTSWTLNITNSITIEAWMKPRPPDFIADIVGLSELFGYTPYITHVNKDIYALIMETQIKAGFLQTVKINEEGSITNLDTEELDKGKSDTLVRPMISQITEKMVLVSFNAKKGSKLFIQMRTYNISASGSIAFTGYELILEDYECPTNPNNPNRPSLIKINNTIWAIAYHTLYGGGILKTLNISSNGKITCIETKTFGSCSEPHLVHVTGEVYALAYRNNASNQGIIRTFNITSKGIISIGQMGVFDTISGHEPCLVQVSGNVFAIVYRNASNKGIVKTLNILPTGSIVLTDKTMAFEPSICVNPRIIYSEDDMYIIIYSSAINPESAIGCIVMINLGKDGSISPISGSQKYFDYNACGNPIIININYGLYGICYTGHSAHPGYLITMLLGPHARGICKGTSYMLYANTTMVEGCINNVFVRYYNDSLDLNWNHYAVTYNGISICLYINGIKVNETTYPFQRITLTKTPLYFGRTYSGYLDEIAIYDQALTQQQIQNHAANPGDLESYYL
jgi:Concanavalin A-like lectin/glucanases superfamily/Archaeal Type IV pilin, N-terminal